MKLPWCLKVMRGYLAYLLHSWHLLTFVFSSSLPCDLTGVEESPFAGTPIGKAFSNTTNRKECIIACWRYPICLKVKKKLKRYNQSVEEDEQSCDEGKTEMMTSYMKGPGWDLYENQGRNDNTGVNCFDLPILVQGFEILKCWGMTCLVMKSDCIGSQVAQDQSCHVHYPKSCAQIKANNPKSKSGQYIIELASGFVTRVTCDMESDGGGWLATFNFTNVGVAVPAPGTVACLSGPRHALSEVHNGRTCVKYGDMGQFMKRNGYTQLRFYCHKTSVGRTVDIATKNDSKGAAVIDYFFGTGGFPDSCDSYYRIKADDSNLGKNCQWVRGKWGEAIFTPKQNFINLPFYIGMAHHYLVDYQNRWECDDMDVTGASKEGSWIHYIR